MSCPDCFRGSVHEGEPRGEVTHAYGLDTYVVNPPDGQQAKGIVVVLPDAFGWEFVNVRLLADQYADQGGFKVYAPDFMNGKRTHFTCLLRTDAMACNSCIGRLTAIGHSAPLSMLESMKILGSPVGILTKM